MSAQKNTKWQFTEGFLSARLPGKPIARIVHSVLRTSTHLLGAGISTDLKRQVQRGAGPLSGPHSWGMTWEVSKGVPIEIHCRKPEGPETRTVLGAQRQYLLLGLGLMSIPLFLVQTLRGGRLRNK